MTDRNHTLQRQDFWDSVDAAKPRTVGLGAARREAPVRPKCKRRPIAHCSLLPRVFDYSIRTSSSSPTAPAEPPPPPASRVAALAAPVETVPTLHHLFASHHDSRLERLHLLHGSRENSMCGLSEGVLLQPRASKGGPWRQLARSRERADGVARTNVQAWGLHKYLCKDSDLDAFRQPPLDRTETDIYASTRKGEPSCFSR